MSPAGSVAEVLARCAEVDAWTPGMCGQFCAAMYGYSASGYASAYVQWQQTPDRLRHVSTGVPPAGSLVFWSGGPGAHGHVAVADGTGRVWSIDILGSGTVGRVSQSLISSRWGLPYLGWTAPYFQGQEWSPSMIYGVDVSNYQPNTVPATTPGDHKRVDFCFIKATQGTSYTNPRMAAQAASARSQGMVVGFYHFLEKGNVAAQAQYFVDRAASQPGDVFAIDWETNPSTSTFPTNADKDAAIKAVQALRPGHRVLLYCNTSFWKGLDTTSFAGDGLWIATAGYEPGSPNVASPWLLHQYSTAGDIDHNVAQFSSQDAMRAWASGGTQDVALTDTEITAIAKKVLTLDGVIESPADAADHATNGFWSLETYVKDTGARVRKATASLDAILAQSRANGAQLSAIKDVLDSIDLSQLPAEIAAKLQAMRLIITVDGGPQA